ncbi:hypothetical protein GF342_00130 [Candidatus Woesearchaeota archaeon]|nr:hypothetical protein [Candidatus Woesearchaeota archaeon]
MAKDTEHYELLPHQEIADLKKELESLKEMDITPTKRLHISIVELNRNIEKLLNIFEEALREIHIEEGGLLFADKIKPVVNRIDRLEKQVGAMTDVLQEVIAPTLTDIHESITQGGMSGSLPPEPEVTTNDIPPPPPK